MLTVFAEAVRSLIPDLRAKSLYRLIKKFKPDIIHSMHIQEAGYLTFKAQKKMQGGFPKWIVTNWGSELGIFSQLKSHEGRIKEVLENCDYFSSECKRDLVISRKYGFKGKFLQVVPNSGGLDFNHIGELRKETVKPSERKSIMLKGYQGWAGRALVGLRALERCSELLKDFKINIYCVDNLEIRISAELFTKKTGIEINIIENDAPHEEILKFHGRARISMGLSITDSISTSLIEAMVMGSFPIQSFTSCANEWIEDKKTGFLIHPEDPDEIERVLRIALSDDNLVNDADKINYENLFKRLEKNKIKKIILDQYMEILNK